VNLEERDGWLYIRLEEADCNPDLDWHQLIRWKIPESERAYVREIDTWIVHGKYRKLIEGLFFIYLALGDSDCDVGDLTQAQEILENIERSLPQQQSTPELSEMMDRIRQGGRARAWPGMYRVEPN